MENGKMGIDYKKASEYLKNNEIVVFPTETVYGIGANALSEDAVDKIFKAKKRPSDNPLIVHISNYNMLNDIVSEINDLEKKIIDKFWPGPISIILPKKGNIPLNVTAGLDTIAVRMPSNESAVKLIEMASVPVAAPSANISSRPSGTRVEDVYEELKDNVKYFLDGGPTSIGIESTVVKVVGSKIVILRPGKITEEDLKTITGNVELDKNCIKKVNNEEIVLSPGMKHKHYAPDVACILLSILDEEKLLRKIQDIDSSEENIGFLVSGLIYDRIVNSFKIENKIINLGSNKEEIGKNLFTNLRELNKLNLDKVYIQGFDYEGLNAGIMNRLIRACQYNEIIE